MIKYLLFGIPAITLLLMPSAAAAYVSYAWDAQPVDETKTLYSISYQFGHGTHDFYLPVRAVRDQTWGTQNKRIGFEILEDSKRRTNDGSAVGVVISDAEITEDEMYFIPKGTKEKFTFYVILSTETDAPEADYAVRVTDLPFYRNDDREYQRLNQSELELYITPEVEFNVSNPSKD